MARDYAKVSARFWTGDTGRQLRALGAEAQVAALYLVTCPSSNMEGLYYLPIPVLVHETGLTQEGASKALRSLGEVGFALYDEAEEVVWVPEMARHQVGEELKAGDKRITGIAKTLSRYRKCRFYRDFVERYRVAFHLAALSGPEAPPRALPSPITGARKALRSQEQDQEQEQEPKDAAAARASARAGAISKLGPGEVEAAPPPPAVEVSPGPVVSTGALPAAPDEPSEAHPGRAIAGTATAAQVGAPLAAVAAFDDNPPRLAPVFDLVELGPAAAEMRARLELRAEWKFLVAAHDRKVQVRSALEELVEALGVDRAEALCWLALERRRRQGLQPPKTLAFFVPLLEEAQRGGDPLPVEVAGVDIDQVRGQRDLEVEQRWAPLIGAMNPAQREAYEAEKRRLADEVRAQGLWTTEEARQLDAAEAFLFEKWSRHVKAAGGET